MQVKTVKERLAAADAEVEKMLRISGTPGISYTVVQRGQTLHKRHLGQRDIEHGLGADDHTRFSINSLTKGVVAALAGIASASGAVDLHAPIKNYLPDFTCSNGALQDQISIIDLLSHRTGITNFDSIWLGSQNAVLVGREQAINTFATLKQCAPFRSSFVYNNWGYDLVGMVLETVMGKPLGELLQEHIFKPLGMTRTSTDWDLDEENSAKSYTVLQDLSAVQIGRPTIGKDTLMEAAGGIKSTIEDLTKFYTAYLRAIVSQFDSGSDSTSHSIFRNCTKLVTNHARFPGPSLREQGYGAGMARAQLPGQLGRISLNILAIDEPTLGKDTESRLVLYHHGSMPGSTSCVHLLPELDAFIVILQNSLAPLDTSDFVCQCLLEALLDVKNPNDYGFLAQQATNTWLKHMDRIWDTLDNNRKQGTSPRPLSTYNGTFWNVARNFHIVVSEENSGLQMKLQGRESETFELTHYENDCFSFYMPYDEIARRGRYITDFGPSYYLIRFSEDGKEEISSLRWAWDPNLPDTPEIFVKEEYRL